MNYESKHFLNVVNVSGIGQENQLTSTCLIKDAPKENPGRPETTIFFTFKHRFFQICSYMHCK